jgi:hypothetical protein
MFAVYVKAQTINNIVVQQDTTSISIQFYNMNYYYENEYFYIDQRQITLISKYSILEFKTQLKWALKNVKKNVCGRYGRFGLNINTNIVYLYDDFGYTELSIKDTKKLMSIIKKYD